MDLAVIISRGFLIVRTRALQTGVVTAIQRAWDAWNYLYLSASLTHRLRTRASLAVVTLVTLAAYRMFTARTARVGRFGAVLFAVLLCPSFVVESVLVRTSTEFTLVFLAVDGFIISSGTRTPFVT